MTDSAEPTAVRYTQSQLNLEMQLILVPKAVGLKLQVTVFLAFRGVMPQSEPCLTTKPDGADSDTILQPSFSK